MENEEDLKAGIAYMRDYAAQVGRTDLPDVILGGVNKPGEDLSNQQIVDRIGTYAQLGVTACGVTVKGRTRSQWCDNAARIGEEVIAKI